MRVVKSTKITGIRKKDWKEVLQKAHSGRLGVVRLGVGHRFSAPAHYSALANFSTMKHLFSNQKNGTMETCLEKKALVTLARAGSVEWYGRARLQGIKNVAEGEEAEEVCATLGEVWQEMTF